MKTIKAKCAMSRKSNMLRDDTCCYDDDVRSWLEVEDVSDILEDIQRIYGGI